MIKISVYYKDGHTEHLEVKVHFAGDVMEAIAMQDDVAYMEWNNTRPPRWLQGLKGQQKNE